MSLVELNRYYNAVEAELARLRLASAGIEAIIFDGETANYVGLATGIRLMVLDTDKEDALRVLESDGNPD